MQRVVGRPGYALLMVLVGLIGVSLVVAVAITPHVAQIRDQWRVEHTIDRLALLTDGETAIRRFRADLLAYPGALSHLSRAITASDRSLCGTSYTSTQVDDWGGRYAGRLYVPEGIPLDIGMLQDTLEYDPGTPVGMLQETLENEGGPAMVLVVNLVREEQARHVDRRTDGSADGAAGRVRYTAADAEGRVTLHWRTPVEAC